MTEKLNFTDTESNNSEAEEILSSMPDFDEHMKEVQGYTVEEWTDFPEPYEGIDESEPDIDGVPQTVWRGERLYLGNIDSLGSRTITTKGHERTNNRDGQTFVSRDKKFASTYAVGTDGVVFYDGPLPVEEIPIGVVYKINNNGNHLGAKATDDEPLPFGPFAGKFREFIISGEVPEEDYEVDSIYIMDDFLQPNGHERSDFRQPIEVYKVKDQEKLPDVIRAVKKRMEELDKKRKS